VIGGGPMGLAGGLCAHPPGPSACTNRGGRSPGRHGGLLLTWTPATGPGRMRVRIRPDWAGNLFMKLCRHQAGKITCNLATAEHPIAQDTIFADACCFIGAMLPTYHQPMDSALSARCAPGNQNRPWDPGTWPPGNIPMAARQVCERYPFRGRDESETHCAAMDLLR
jgi:hypothetical protein